MKIKLKTFERLTQEYGKDLSLIDGMLSIKGSGKVLFMTDLFRCVGKEHKVLENLAGYRDYYTLEGESCSFPNWAVAQVIEDKKTITFRKFTSFDKKSKTLITSRWTDRSWEEYMSGSPSFTLIETELKDIHPEDQ